MLGRKCQNTTVELTDLSYVSSSLVESPWMTKFRDDITMARAVFFVGYSLKSDLDIKRVLFSSTSLIDKCIFILGPDPTPSTLRRAQQYGSPLSISTDDFALQIQEKQKTYMPRVVDFAGRSIVKVVNPAKTLEFSDKLIFDLLFYGTDNPYFVHFETPKRKKYYLQRDQYEDVLEALKISKIIVIHADLGNGKTMFLEGFKYRALEKGFDVFDVVTPSDEMLGELDEAIQKSKRMLLIVDNYHNWMDVVEYYSKHAKDNSRIILSARNSINDVLIDDLYDFFDVNDIPEFSLDKLSKNEINWINGLFNDYGLWGDRASSVPHKKIERLEWLGDFQAILLDILKSPQIFDRLNLIISTLKDKKEYYDVILSILILTILNYRPSIDKLIDFWGEKILDSRFKKNDTVQQILEINTDEIKLRSAVSARYILKRIADPDLTINVLIRMAKTANDRALISPYYAHMFKNLMKYSNVQSVLPDKIKLALLVKYYENIKNLSKSRENPLFWLQYAISCLVFEDFVRAGKYFETSYSYGEDKGYDLFQIDNHYARYLLLRIIKEKNWRDPFDVFIEAHAIVSRQMANDRLSYPYRVARLYANFYKVYELSLSIEQLQVITDIAKQIYSKISFLPDEKRAHKNIQECESAMKQILMQRK